MPWPWLELRFLATAQIRILAVRQTTPQSGIEWIDQNVRVPQELTVCLGFCPYRTVPSVRFLPLAAGGGGDVPISVEIRGAGIAG